MNNPQNGTDGIIEELEAVYETNPDWAERNSDFLEWYRGEYPLHQWGLDHLMKFGVKATLDHLFDRIETIEKRLGNWDSTLDPHGDGYNDECYQLRLEQVACSQATIGLVAPFVETFIRESSESLKQRFNETVHTSTGKDDRTALEEKEFWDPTRHFTGWKTDKPKGRRPCSEKNICQGYLQLLDLVSLGFTRSVTFDDALRALFGFRNKALHRIVWSKKKDENNKTASERMAEEINQKGWNNWFSVTRVYERDEFRNMVEVEVSDITVERRFADDILDEVTRFGSELAQRLC